MPDYELTRHDQAVTVSEEMNSAVKGGMAICAALPNAPTVSQVLRMAWAELFAEEGLTPGEIAWAFKQHLKTSKWFPAPAELIGYVTAEKRRLRAERRAEASRVKPLPMRQLTPEEIVARQIEVDEFIEDMPEGPVKDMFLDIVNSRESRRLEREGFISSRPTFCISSEDEVEDARERIKAQIRAMRDEQDGTGE